MTPPAGHGGAGWGAWASEAARLLPAETAHGLAIAGLKALEPWARRRALQAGPTDREVGAEAGAGAEAPSAAGVDNAQPDAASSQPNAAPVDLSTRLLGLELPHPVGLAAGFDKGGEVPDACLALGFAFVECGAVTPLPQPGNPKPRVFRDAPNGAVINRLGFNSDGLEAMVARLRRRREFEAATGATLGVVGINLGANKDSADRAGDYATCLKALWRLADFFTINISSPNTAGLRDLQGRGALGDLLTRTGEMRAGLAGDRAAKPLLVKIAPDLDEPALDTLLATVRESGVVDGLIVSNTTLARPAHLEQAFAAETGGLSGRPLFERSTEMLKQCRRALGPRMTLIGVGGVEDGRTAYAKIRAGAAAVQLYTALVYQGPGVARRIVRELEALLAADGLTRLADAVGLDAR